MRKALAMFSVAACILGAAPTFAQSYHGVTCDQVRSLSRAEQNYWCARLKLTPQQRHRIYVACYLKYVPHRG